MTKRGFGVYVGTTTFAERAYFWPLIMPFPGGALFQHTSYLTGGKYECDFSQTDVSITDIQLKNNSASAQVTADGDCFLNFSQTYYPGWNAYVDGDQVELYEVNGLIQGIFVPAGTHVVEFRFQPIVFYIGCGISLLTVMACVFCGVFENRKHGILK